MRIPLLITLSVCFTGKTHHNAIHIQLAISNVIVILDIDSGGVWTCPYTMESIATLNWAMGKTGYYPKGYIPPAAIMKSREEREQEPVRDPDEVFKEMENSTFGEDMPQCVRDRLDFM